jgi:hypothetical protein
MTHRTCTVNGCDKKHEARGYCKMHLRRVQRHGDPAGGRRKYKTPEESFIARRCEDGACLVWGGHLDDDGYGLLWIGKGYLAHRYAWERVNGPIPEGMLIDHRCHNHACVRIEHLRLATRKQNAENVLGAYSHNKSSGVLGVTWDKVNKKWVAQVQHNRKHYHLGRFTKLEDAAESVRQKRLELFTHNDHDRRAA